MQEPPDAGLTRIVLRDAIAMYRGEIGEHTYGRPTIMKKGRAHLKIGDALAHVEQQAVCQEAR